MFLTHCAILVDNSGSMYYDIPNFTGQRYTFEVKPRVSNLADNLETLAEELRKQSVSVSFTVFSDDAISGPDIKALLARHKSRGTNISAGFKKMLEKCWSKEQFEHVVVIFISDGQDEPKFTQDRKSLLPLPVKSTLLTIAVGNGFPTGTVLSDLYPKYHTSEDKSHPLVLPIEPSEEDHPEVMNCIRKQLCDIVLEIASGVPPKRWTVDDLEGMDNEAILQTCRLWYNELTVRSMCCACLPEKIDLMNELRDRLNAAEQIMRRGFSGNPLLLSNTRNVSANHLTNIREKINTALAQLNKGRLFEMFTDKEKQELMAFGNPISGKYSSKAVKYRGADANRVILRFKEKARGYTPSEFETQLTEVFSLCSLAEIWEDIKVNEDLLDHITSMPDIFKSIAFYGRGLQVYKPEACQMNPWLISVLSMPKIVKVINTIDLYRNSQGKLVINGETHDNMLILGGSPKFLDVETHVQTFTIAGWMCYHKDARLAMVGSVLVFLLKSEDGLQEWKLNELDLLRSVLSLHTPENSRWWYEYREMLQSNPRKCLVTESKELPPSIRCQGLSKFILALWQSIDEGKSYDSGSLRDLLLAFLVEFLGRCRADTAKYLRVTFGKDDEALRDFLDVKVKLALKEQCFTPEQLRNFTRQQAFFFGLKQSKHTSNSIEVYNRGNDSHFNLTLNDIDHIFGNLAKLAKITDWQPTTDDELIRALLIVQTCNGSMARSRPAHLHAAMPEVKAMMIDSLTAGARLKRIDDICEAVCKLAADFLHLQHVGLPRRLPDSLMQRYLEETGRDIAKDYEVDAQTGLSAVACCFPGCDHFLTIPKGNSKQKRSTLKAHLFTSCKVVIPGLHACVIKSKGKSASSVLKMVEAGECLKQPFASRSYGSLGGQGTNDLKRLQRTQKQNLDKAIADYNGGDSKRLYHLIERMQDSIENNTHGWGYQAFKMEFDAKYA